MANEANIMAADPRNYQLPGKVSLWFRKKGSVADADWRDLGNIIDPALGPAIERLDHFSQRRGVRAKDRSVITERNATLNFSIDEINLHNIQFALGSVAAPTASTVDVNSNKVATNPGGGGTINLGQTNIVGASVVVRSVLLEGQVTYATPADYTVNAAAGTISIVALGALDNPVTVPEVHIFWRKNVTTQKFTVFTGSEIEGEAKFQVLTDDGLQTVGEFKNVIIRNNGDITWGDGTTWQAISLSMDILQDSSGDLGTEHVVDEDEL